MKRSLEKKFEALIQNIKSQQYDGQLVKNPLKIQLAAEELIKLAENLHTSKTIISRQRDELLFAYQTLEVGYQRYWEYFNFAPDGYLVTDTDGIILEANQTILSMLSISYADILGKPITALIPDIKHQDFGMQLNWFVGSQQKEVFFHPAGHFPFYASISIAPQCNVHNKTIALLWLVRDITERKKMEEALQKSKAELSLLLDQAPYLLWTTDTDLKITSVSGVDLPARPLCSEDIIGLSVGDYFTFEPENIMVKAHETALQGTLQTFDFEWHGCIYQSTVEPLKDSSGRIMGVIGAAFDITERKQAEKILLKSEKFNSSLLQHSPNPIIVINSDTSISYVNPAFEKLTGFTAGSIISLKAPYPWWMFPDPDKALVSFCKLLNKKKSKMEFLFRKKGAGQFWVEVTTIQIQNEDEPPYYLQTWVDITESKRLRENMEFYMMQVTRVQEEERKRIAQELHEETVQSLSALCLATESIIKAKRQDPQDTLTDLEDLRDKINDVIDQVRSFSYGLRPGVLDYLGLTAALETLTDELNKKGIKTNTVISGKERPLPPEIEITLFRITQEALSNIKKYSHATTVNITLCYSPARVKLVINDNGQGFRIPERLSELANEGKLGLIGIEERTRLYGGSFSLYSRPRKGTRITISLPVSAAPE
jgi:PAS domain S-box-containing protein